MIYYITSPYSAIIKINGVFLDEIDENLYSFESDGNPYIELLPLSEELCPVCFKIDKITYKSKKVYLYEFNGGIFILPIYPQKNDLPFKYIYSLNDNENSIYVYNDNLPKAFIQTKTQSNLFILPFEPIRCDCSFLNDLLFLKIYAPDKNALICFSLKEGIDKKFIKHNCLLDINKQHIECKCNNLTKLQKDIYFNLNGDITQENNTRSRAIAQLNPLLLPFAFLEEVLLNGNYNDYLHPNLLPHSNLILNFLGEFYTFTPYNKKNESLAILIGESMKTVKITTLDNKINDISIV